MLYENTGNGVRFHKKANTEDAPGGADVKIRNGKVILYWSVNTTLFSTDDLGGPEEVKYMEVEY